MPDETLFPLPEVQGTDDEKVVPTGLARIQFAVRNQVEILMKVLGTKFWGHTKFWESSGDTILNYCFRRSSGKF